MKLLFLTILLIASSQLFADIAPTPIVVKGIYTTDKCKIQMTSEFVFANLFNDSAKVECTFNLKNFGDATKIQVGFPEMNFQYWSLSNYGSNDKANFKIYVNGKLLTENDIQVPSEMDSVYKKYMLAYYFDKEYRRKEDSIYTANGVKFKNNKTIYPPGAYERTEKALEKLSVWRDSKPRIGPELWTEFEKQKKKGNFPWYVWNVQFEKQEKKQIKVVYSLPSGLGYGADYRYFKYILETGSGWYKTIEQAEIEIQLHDIDPETLEKVSPSNYNMNKEQKTIKWTFTDFEPTDKDDIYVRYYNINERRKWKKVQKKRKRAFKS